MIRCRSNCFRQLCLPCIVNCITINLIRSHKKLCGTVRDIFCHICSKLQTTAWGHKFKQSCFMRCHIPSPSLAPGRAAALISSLRRRRNTGWEMHGLLTLLGLPQGARIEEHCSFLACIHQSDLQSVSIITALGNLHLLLPSRLCWSSKHYRIPSVQCSPLKTAPCISKKRKKQKYHQVELFRPPL